VRPLVLHKTLNGKSCSRVGAKSKKIRN